jgi:hypothetical protein
MAIRYLLIGSGAAGISAAEAIRRRDRSGVITILSEEPHAFYSRPGLAYYLTGMIPETQLFPRPERSLHELGIQRLNGRAVAIDPVSQLAAGGRIAYDRLLLAPGALAVRPKVPGIELEGVVTLDSLTDARRILRLARRAKRGVVVGGGIVHLPLLPRPGRDRQSPLRAFSDFSNCVSCHPTGANRRAETRAPAVPGNPEPLPTAPFNSARGDWRFQEAGGDREQRIGGRR